MAQTKPDCTIVITIQDKQWRIRLYVGLWRKLSIVCRFPDGTVKKNNGNGSVTKLLKSMSNILKEMF